MLFTEQEVQTRRAVKSTVAVSPSTLEILPAAVIVLSETGHIREINAAARALLTNVDCGDRWRDVIDRCFEVDAASQAVRLRDGRHVRLETCPHGSGGGQILVLTDISESIALQRQVARRERLSALGEVSASLAHQIRTPLSAALLYSSQLEEQGLTELDRIRFAGRLTERLQALEALVRDMLLYVRGEVVGACEVQLEQVIAQLALSLEVEVERADATLEVACHNPSVTVLGNAETLISALHNLASNALQAGARTLRIGIECGRPGTQHVDLLVIDDGPGIASELRERVFDAFYTTRSGGTGLGLAVARTVARAHHGDLLLDSEPGGGSRFTLRLPTTECAARVVSAWREAATEVLQ